MCDPLARSLPVRCDARRENGAHSTETRQSQSVMESNPQAFGTLRNSPIGAYTAIAGPRSVLICDHRGAGIGKQLSELRADGWTVEIARDVRHSRASIAECAPDALILDPAIEGGAAEIAELDGAGAGRVPLLLLADPERISEALGIWSASPGRIVDIAHRGSGPVEINARLEHLTAECATREELRRLRYCANYDDRTDLLRPEAFQRRVLEHWSAAQRHDLPLALVIADLDQFGQFNKRYDHTVGDRVLAQVGEAVRSALRTEDVAGRLGGDEFGFLLPYTSRSDAARVARRLCESIRGVTVDVEGTRLRTSASLGFVSRDGNDIDTPEALRLRAENALREAKRRGGDRELDYRWLLPALGA